MTPAASASGARAVEHPVQIASTAAPDTSAQMCSGPAERASDFKPGEYPIVPPSTPDPFDELLTALNPYADELVYQPTFHLFTKLPVELRCRVYVEYFMDEHTTISCQGWPNLRFSQSYVRSILTRRRSARFLPNLCLVSKELQDEMISCLLEAAHVEFNSFESVSHVSVLWQSSMEFSLKTRKMSMQNINSMRRMIVTDLPLCKNEQSIRGLAQRVMVMHGQSIRSFPRLRELTLECYAPVFLTWPDSAPGTTHILKATPIKYYPENFPLESILGLEELQCLRIISIGSCCNRSPTLSKLKNVVWDKGKADHLEAVSDICRQIKKGFREQGHNVRVTACLQYAPNESVEKIFT